MSALFRLYAPEECGKDGYPPEWHNEILVGARRFQGLKGFVRDQAGYRCVRCGHPYVKGAGEWSPCDETCKHEGPLAIRVFGRGLVTTVGWDEQPLASSQGAEAVLRVIRDTVGDDGEIVARWRILTVHHLDLDKANCRWWNLAALCQRCHLTIQGRVQLHRVWPWPHSEWFKPYAAGWYAHAYLNENLDREQTMARLDELLALELA